MAYTIIQGAAALLTSYGTLTFPNPITPGNAIFIFTNEMVKFGNPGNPLVGADVLNFLPNTFPTALIWKTNCTGGGTVVIWPGSGGDYWSAGFGASVIGMEVSGVPDGLTQDLQQTPSTFSIDTQVDNELIIAAFISNALGMTMGPVGTQSPVAYSDTYGDSGVIGFLAAPTIGTYTFEPVYTGFAQMWAFGFVIPPSPPPVVKTCPVCWSFKTPEVYSAGGSDPVFLEKVAVRGVSPNPNATVTLVRQGTVDTQIQRTRLWQAGAQQFILQSQPNARIINVAAIIEGCGPAEIELVEWQAKAKPFGVPLSFMK